MRELELLATIDHGGAAAIHAYGAWKGGLPPHLAGAAITTHVFGAFFNLRRGNWFDASAHVAGFFASLSDDRLAHATMALYDGVAAVRHGKAAAEAPS